MQQITTQELNLLISKNFLKMEGGKYPDLCIVGRQKKSRRRKYFLPEKYLFRLYGKKSDKPDDENELNSEGQE